MLDRAVDAHDAVPRHREAGQPYRTFLAGFTRAIAGDFVHASVGKERDIEIHRLFGAGFKHQERQDTFGHQK
ncbi:hypothetical protein D3C83_199800 [compost metagenome]